MSYKHKVIVFEKKLYILKQEHKKIVIYELIENEITTK